MDEETRLVPLQQRADALAPNESMVPVPVALDELATRIVAALDMVAAIIPDLRKPHPATARRVRGARTIPREAVSSIVAMVEATPILQRLCSIDTQRAHEVLDSTDAFRVVAERLEMLRAQVKYTAEERWAEVAAEAMGAYRIACGFARDPAEGAIAAHLATIRRHLGRRNRATGKRKAE